MIEYIKGLMTFESSLVGGLGIIICSLLWYIRFLKDSVTDSSGSFTLQGKVVHVTIVWTGAISALCSGLYVCGYLNSVLSYLSIF